MTTENETGDRAGDGAGDRTHPTGRPLLRVLNSDATPEEVAALVAVFASLGGEESAPRPRSQWSGPARLHRRPVHPGHDGWRASGQPR